MKRMKISQLLIISSILIITISGCKKDEDETAPILQISDNRVFIASEGPFQTGTGTVSIFYRDSLKVLNNVFEQVNNQVLGNIVQSIEVFNEKAYIVVNNANKIEVVDEKDFVSTATIEGIVLPRYFLGINNTKAYVTSWNNVISVVDLNTNTEIKIIPAGTGPEKMLLAGNKVFVLNQGGFGIDSTITVIDAQSDNVITTINVEKKPTGIQLDVNGKVWIICSGNGWNGWPQPGDTEGHLICINPDDYSIEEDFAFPTTSEHPEKLIINKDKNVLYYIYPGGVYSFDINSTELNLTLLIERPAGFYGLGFDNSTEYIYATDPLDFVQDGWFFRYNAVTGAAVDSFKVGIIPGEFYFN